MTVHPMDDVLAMAETCARILADQAKRKAYQRFRRSVVKASEDWNMTPTAKAMVLKTYNRAFREAMGMDAARERSDDR